MSNALKPGLRQQQRSLSDRVGALEQNLARALMGVQQRFQALDQRTTSLEELVEALVNIQGSEDVQSFVDGRRLERAERLAAQEKASLEEAVKDGYVLPVEKVGEKSILVGKYIGADGGVIPPGRVQLVMAGGVAPEFRDKLLGQTVGKTLDLANGEKYELSEIYEVDEAKAKAVISAKAAAAVQDAAKAAAAAAEEAKAAEGEEAPAAPTEAK
jgi:hypothetical protein